MHVGFCTSCTDMEFYDDFDGFDEDEVLKGHADNQLLVLTAPCRVCGVGVGSPCSDVHVANPALHGPRDFHISRLLDVKRARRRQL